MTLSSGRDGALLHGFEQGGLRLGWRPVDLVGQDDVGEERTLVELEPPLVIQNLGADDVAGHQVWRELNAVEAQAQGLCDGVDEQGLRQSGDPDQQTVSTAEDGGEHLLYHLFLTHDDLADLRGQLSVLSPQRVQRFFV